MQIDTKTDKIEPCECGYRPDHYTTGYGPQPFYVSCLGCGKSLHGGNNYPEGIIHAWNIDYRRRESRGVMFTLSDRERAAGVDLKPSKRSGARSTTEKVSDSPPLASNNTKTANGEFAAPLGSATYDPKACCGSDCWAFGDGKGQCWGKVEAIDSMGDDPDGGEIWVHACQGHKEMWQDYGNGGPELYVSEPQSPNA